MNSIIEPKPLTIEERSHKMVEMVNQMVPRNLQADTVVCPCNDEHRPVYPVRYAYSNLYGDYTAKAAMPPEIKKLLELCPATDIDDEGLCSIEDTKGFSARLLRSGWVYVFEEGDYPTRTDTEGKLLIFKHTITYAHNGQVYDESDTSNEATTAIEAGDADEFFIPHTRVYNSNSQAWELQEQFPHYPYLAIKKDVITARFFFSDIPLSDYTLNKMATDLEFRRSFMQEINLVNFSDNPYALEANENHINYLVEEYKDEASKFSVFVEQTKKIGSKLPSEYFSEITNTPNISKGAQSLLSQMKASLDYGEKSSLIILHDPVGYQKDILSLYSFITTAYASFQHHWSYPNQVGHYLSAIKEHLIHPDILQTAAGNQLHETFLDNIDVDGWQTYWPEIELGYKEFEKLQSHIVQLYSDFLSNPSIKNEIGGIKNYIDHVFLIKEQYEQGYLLEREFFDEIKAYGEFHELLLSPLNSSKSGIQTLNLIFSVDKPEGELWKSLCDIVTKLLEEDELKKGGKRYFKEQKLSVLQSIVLICWDALGYSFIKNHSQLSKAASISRNITQSGIDFLAKKVLPVFLEFFDLRVSFDKLNLLSGQQFMSWMDSLNGNSVGLNTPKDMKMLLNWEEKLRNAKAAGTFTTIQFYYMSSGLPVDKETFKNTRIFGVAISSLLMGILEFHAAKITEYDKNDPLNVGAVNIFRMQMIIHLFSITEGIIKTREAAGVYVKRVTYPPLQRILLKISLPEAQSALAKLGIKSLGYIVALLGAGLPLVESMAEFDKKNYVAGGAKFTEALATLALSIGVAGVGEANAIIDSAAAMSKNPVIRFITRFAWQIVLIAVVVLVVSSIIYHLFKTDKFTELLKNCFWGNGSKYFAGGYVTEENQKTSRPKRKLAQLKKYIDNYEKYTAYYQVELQEFLNFFFTPQLKIISKGNVTPSVAKNYYSGMHYIIRYQFKLTNFQCGISDIEYQLIEPKPLFVNQSTTNSANRDVVIKRDGIEYIASQNSKFNAAFEQALALALNNASPREGEFEFNVDIDVGICAGDPLKSHSIPSLYWYYLVDRIRGDIAPLRYRGANLQEKICGYINDEGTE
ncbi:hypothetical protein U2T78_002906 [Providencia stuartii]|uniref:Toxin VasX N-terminal region domain-containing protein n=2 Tax=Enterobacterales TaxID=91347 RepID=A0AAJ1JGA7_PROST|nr:MULTISPECIES: toxin VasX [Providencia]EMA3642163.1 hypothetical protein [Providencia stuartii]MBW3101884.1 hypothetical protein [Providencia stuartii]MCB5217562.1 hypothetical protein [Providencia stuartii]MDE8749550.1 hypothetical protein [Providencia thailandensis]MDE8769353.1 hypothetical protein [Providencia thailandensis]